MFNKLVSVGKQKLIEKEFSMWPELYPPGRCYPDRLGYFTGMVRIPIIFKLSTAGLPLDHRQPGRARCWAAGQAKGSVLRLQVRYRQTDNFFFRYGFHVTTDVAGSLFLPTSFTHTGTNILRLFLTVFLPFFHLKDKGGKGLLEGWMLGRFALVTVL